ncbi:chemotaxis protein CheW [Methylobacterium sp. BTF04]|nr:chemotaxis protein CheW [Methylobacterium sp. BTF04]
MTSSPDAESARREALLDARAAALAIRGHTTARIAETQPFLICTCGDDRYGLALASVAQVLPGRPCTAVPGGPPALLGIVALSGRVVSVLALAPALGRLSGAAPETGHFVVLRGGPILVALAVDRVVGVIQAADSSGPNPGFDLAGLGAEAVSGYAPGEIAPVPADAGEAGFVVVDVPRLLRRYCP